MKPLALMLILLAGPVQAQSNCAPRERVIGRLAERYSETPRMIGITAQNNALEVYASDETGTWTIIVTYANGMTCVSATGMNFEQWAVVAPPGQKM
jgi:hypothetical protein